MANGTLAASQLEMLSQSGTGIMTIVPPATNTNRTLTLPDSTGTVATLGTSLTLATAVASTSGTSIDFTGIPSWTKRITVMFAGVSTNGTSPPLIQLGTSAGLTTSGYVGRNQVINTGISNANLSSSFLLGQSTANWAAAVSASGEFTVSLVNANIWVMNGQMADNGGGVYRTAGSVSLPDTLTQVRITTANGTDTFDAGTINIMYEG